jgi:hypothetical protein
MTIMNWIGLALIAGLGVATFYNGTQTTQLRDQLLVAESALDAAVGRVDALQAEQAQQADALEQLGSTNAIARSILGERHDELVADLVSTLMSNPETVGRLTGPQGPSPDVEKITTLLIDQGLAEVVGYRIWEERYQELATMPDVIAEVANAVYHRYGSELKGKDGLSVSAEDVARVLAIDPTFVAFLELTKE